MRSRLSAPLCKVISWGGEHLQEPFVTLAEITHGYCLSESLVAIYLRGPRIQVTRRLSCFRVHGPTLLARASVKEHRYRIRVLQKEAYQYIPQLEEAVVI